MQKQRVFQAGIVFSQSGGWAPAVEKCDFPREKATRYGFTPLKRPSKTLKSSQKMRIHAETTRIRSQTAHKSPTAAIDSPEIDPVDSLCIAKYTSPATTLPEGVMHVREALERLDQIHDQLTKSEVYRGFRVPTVAAVGFLGLGAAACQPVVPAIDFVWYWMAVAGACAALGMAAVCTRTPTAKTSSNVAEPVESWRSSCPASSRARRSRPGSPVRPELTAFLPGLWAVLFGLGVVAARPHLPPATGMVGLGYIVAGAMLVLRAPRWDGTEPVGGRRSVRGRASGDRARALAWDGS